MTLTEILSGGAVGLFVLLSLIEVSKIKINPWSALIGWIGRALTSDLSKQVSKLEKDVGGVKQDLGDLRAEYRESEAKAARNRILRFGDEVYQGVHHSKEYFDHILADISNYKIYCKEHPDFQNEMTVMTVQHIESIYQKCLTEHDFL